MSKFPRSDNIEELNPEFRRKLKDVLARCPWMQVWEAGRSNERQQYLYDKGGVTKAKAGQSAHNYFAAADLVLDPRYVKLPTRTHKGKEYPSLWDTSSPEVRALWFLYGQTAEEFGLVWGGRFGKLDENGMGFDPPHVELKDWRKLRK